MAKSLVLVTGASGFVGTHVITLLLKEGYAVRGTARPGRIDSLKAAPISQHPDFSLVQVEDIAESDLTEAMAGVSAVIHVASPLAGQGDAAKMIKAARGGVLNILRSALNAGISKVVITSSSVTMMGFDEVYKNGTIISQAFRDLDEEDVLNTDPSDFINIYSGSKILAEKAAWDFVQANPSIDLATIHPFTIVGPVNDQFPDPDPTRLGANIMIHLLLNGEPGRPLPEWLAKPLVPHFCDVRDVAKAHVRALQVDTLSRNVSDKRYLVCGGHFSWKQAVSYLEQTMPQLKERLPDVTDAPDLPQEVASIDVSLARDSLQLDGFIGWEQMLVDTVESLLVLENK
ncbi:NAD(P)-binding protein [Hymenopellis radicata]|nr:NAD(P)-binding protein [Hymenopellis radicata]